MGEYKIIVGVVSSAGIVGFVSLMFKFIFSRIKCLEDDMKEKADKADMIRNFKEGKDQFEKIQGTLTNMHGVLSSMKTKVEYIETEIKNGRKP